MIASFFCGFFVLIAKKGNEGSKAWGLKSTAFLGVVTTAAVFFGIKHHYCSEQRKGVVLDYNKQTGLVCLPRQNKSFEKKKIVCFQIVKDFVASEPVAELQLIVKALESFEVFCLAQTSTFYLLEPIAKQLMEKISTEVWVVEHPSDFGKKKINEYRLV